MIVKLLTEHHLEFVSLKGRCRGLSKSTLVKMLEISCHCSYVIFSQGCPFKNREGSKL